MAETIESVEISDVAEERFSTYAKYAITSRALPDVRDGLKPVQRRILYAMSVSKNTYDSKYRKSAKTVGEVIGNYHPHGDSSVYEAMVRMSQHWSLRMPLIDMHGNNGSLDGDSPAAMRYTEARLSQIVTDGMTKGLEKNGLVEFVDNFDDTDKEPVVFPVHFPNLLVNGSTGISTAYATNIAPHNLGELMDACIHLRRNPSATVEDLMEFVPAPDFPTGGVIVGASGLKKMYETGKGDVKFRAKYHIESDKKRQYIVFDDIPYEMKKGAMVDKLKDIAQGKEVVGMLDARDESGLENGEPVNRVVVECSKDADLQVILGYIFSKTPMQKNYSMNMVAIRDGKPVQLGLKEILVVFNDFRTETRRKELAHDKDKCDKRLHIVEGFLKLADILDEVIPVIRESDGKAGAKAAIIEKFGFSSEQAEEIVIMQLHRLSRTDKAKYEKEEADLLKKLKALNILLTNDKKLNEHIIRLYEKVKNEFATERRSEVIMGEESWDVAKTDIIKEEDVVVSISKGGYIKRSSLRSFNSTEVSGIVEGDEEVFSGQGTTKGVFMVFTNKGNYMYVPIHEIEECKWKETGKHLANYGVDLADGEYMIGALIVDVDDMEKYVVTAKTNGLVKRTKVVEHEVAKRYFSLYTAVKIKEDEEVTNVWLLEDDGFIGFKDKKGKSMYFAVDEIPVHGIKTGGVRGIHLDAGDTEVDEIVCTMTEEEMPEGYRRRERGKKGYAVPKDK
ncbi:DNA gyrase/topoisomerase IV subunit A [Bacillus cereus group sp. MYBK15-3]|uniref:DNA gyrase/topoisomerase IV subunit A n=1 Tax=unclassified Bacillus cereus group TaxID=2750818 RepID=UPI003F7AE972